MVQFNKDDYFKLVVLNTFKDINPETDFEVKIIDFGHATKVGEIIKNKGNHMFMSPNIKEGEN